MIRLSPQVLLYDSGSKPPVSAPGALVLPQTLSEAFGDGSHPTTRLCAGAVDLICRQKKPPRVLDVGTGTGVLARIARARGAERIVATDIDAVALASSRENAGLDAAPTEILISESLPDHWGAVFDLVIANILEGVIRDLAPALVRALAPQGILLVAGFTAIQTPILRLTFTGLGLSFVSESHLEDWALLMFSRKSAVPPVPT